ncbi:Ja182 [Japanese cytomegalovirus]|nr:Ja182 [Japanese cytomegalovirus]
MAFYPAMLVFGGVALQFGQTFGQTFGWYLPLPVLTEEELAARRALYTVSQTTCYLEGGKLFVSGHIIGDMRSYVIQMQVWHDDTDFDALRFSKQDIKFTPGKLEYDLRYYEVDWTIIELRIRFQLNNSDIIWSTCEPHVKPDFMAHDYFWTFCRAYWFQNWWLLFWCVVVTAAHFVVCALAIVLYVFHENTLKVLCNVFMC